MKSMVRFVIAPTLIVLTGISAEAGLPVTSPVTITQGSGGTGTLSGSIGSTRNGAGTLQYLGTWAQIGFPVQSGSSVIDPDELSGGITAENTSGVSVNCMFPEGAMFSYLPQLALVNSDSYLSVGYEPVTHSTSNDLSQTRCNGPTNIPIAQCCNSLEVASSSYDQHK